MTTFPVYAPALTRTATAAQTRFLVRHLWLPLAGVLVLSALLMSAGGDQWIADALYRLEGGHWLLKDHWFTSGVIHRVGKWLSTAAAVSVLVLALVAWCRPRLRAALAADLSGYIDRTVDLAGVLAQVVDGDGLPLGFEPLWRHPADDRAVRIAPWHCRVRLFSRRSRQCRLCVGGVVFLCAGTASCMACSCIVAGHRGRAVVRDCAATARRAFPVARPVVAGGVLGTALALYWGMLARPHRANEVVLQSGDAA